MIFLYVKLKHFLFNWRSVAHPSISSILSSLFTQIKNLYLQKDKTLYEVFLLYIKTIYILDYCFLYFCIYTPVGIFLLFFSSYLLFNNNLVYVLIAKGFLGTYVVCLIGFIIQTQLDFYQKTLIGFIGEQAFGHYVGFNPASNIFKKGGIGGTILFFLGGGTDYCVEINKHLLARHQHKLNMQKILFDLDIELEQISKKAELALRISQNSREVCKQTANDYVAVCVQAGVSPDVSHLGKLMPSIKDYSLLPKIVTDNELSVTSLGNNAVLSESPTINSVIENSSFGFFGDFPCNAIASFGSYLFAISLVYFFYVIFLALTNSKKTAANPRSSVLTTSYTLEWVLPSAPALNKSQSYALCFHTFVQTPVIRETPSK